MILKISARHSEKEQRKVDSNIQQTGIIPVSYLPRHQKKKIHGENRWRKETPVLVSMYGRSL
jgi:hypothetical protein